MQLEIYVTRTSEEKADEEMGMGSIPNTASSETDIEKAVPNVTAQPLRSADSVSSGESTAEETESVPTNAYENSIKSGKPDVSALIRTEIEETPVENRILVLGCGPDGLMTQVRNTTAACIRSDGPGVELHCEQFGW